jgi:hypothetical protein
VVQHLLVRTAAIGVPVGEAAGVALRLGDILHIQRCPEKPLAIRDYAGV